MKKCLKYAAVFLIALLVLLLPACSQGSPEMKYQDNAVGANAGLDLDKLFDAGLQQNVLGIYDKGYDSIEELMEVAAVVVRATPVEKELESAVGVCWKLQVEESSQGELSTVYLRQLKDKYLLQQGQEVVLVLAPEGDAGYYNIPGGGYGLFRMNEATGAMEGVLLDSLLETTAEMVPADDSLTLETVYDLLSSST